MLRESVRSYIIDEGLTHSTLLIAVSGGVDSVVLAHTLASLQHELGLHLHLGHVHHGMRGHEADADETFVQSIASALNIPCQVARVDTLGTLQRLGTGSIESIARHLRYTALTSMATQVGASVVAVAHSADDVAETVLMHLARGSGIDGLGSHAHRRRHNTIEIIRPLHRITRDEILSAAHEGGWQWREDTSNTDTRLLRNHVRHALMPRMHEVFGKDITRALERTAEVVHDTRTALDHLLQPILERTITRDVHATHLHIAPLLQQEPAIQTEIIRAAVRPLLPYPASYHDTHRIHSLLTAEVGSQATLHDGLLALRDRDAIILTALHHLESPNNADSAVILHDVGTFRTEGEELIVTSTTAWLPPTADTLCIPRDAIDGPLQWRPWAPGDRIQPFGMQGHALVSDVITDAKVAHRLRQRVRVLEDSKGILWVCGLKAAERTRVDRATPPTLLLFTIRSTM